MEAKKKSRSRAYRKSSRLHDEGIGDIDADRWRGVPACHVRIELLVEHMLTRLSQAPIMNGILERLLRHPRWLQVTTIAAAILLAIWLLQGPLGISETPASQAMRVPPVRSTPESQSVVLASPNDVAGAVLATITAYNEASITAGLLGRSDLLAPYLALEGQAWADIQVEYTRRKALGEYHEAQLVRWGVLKSEVAGENAIVETQEQWNDITIIGDAITDSQYGVHTRNIYTLRRSSAEGSPWLITTITTTLIIQ